MVIFFRNGHRVSAQPGIEYWDSISKRTPDISFSLESVLLVIQISSGTLLYWPPLRGGILRPTGSKLSSSRG